MWELIKNNIPSLFALLIAIVTVGGNILLGKVKNKTDVKSALSLAETAFRDDLLEYIQQSEERIKKCEDAHNKKDERITTKDERIGLLQTANAGLLEENIKLKLELLESKHLVKSLTEQVQAFTRKVYYKAGDEPNNV